MMRHSAVPARMDDMPLPSRRPSAASRLALWRGAAQDGPVRLQLVSARALPGFFVVASSSRGSCPAPSLRGRAQDPSQRQSGHPSGTPGCCECAYSAECVGKPGQLLASMGTFARCSRKLPRINVQGARYTCVCYEGLTHEQKYILPSKSASATVERFTGAHPFLQAQSLQACCMASW